MLDTQMISNWYSFEFFHFFGPHLKLFYLKMDALFLTVVCLVEWELNTISKRKSHVFTFIWCLFEF